MARTKKTDLPADAPDVATVDERPSYSEIEYRTALAECKIKELKALKDKVDWESKSRNLCRIDVAMAEFSAHCVRHCDAWRGLADEIQAIVPSMSPTQYRQVQAYALRQIDALYNTLLHLSIDTTEDERARYRENVAKVRAAKDDGR